MARLIRGAGVKPELEVFDLGHVVLARPMVEGILRRAAVPAVVHGVLWGAPATAEAVLAMRAGLPPGALWSAFGIFRHQFPTVALAAVLGGHVRVGLEDNLYLSRGVLAPGNAALVRGIGAQVATRAWALLGAGLGLAARRRCRPRRGPGCEEALHPG